MIEEPKKKGNGLVIVVIILLLICLGLGGFIYLNKDKIFTQQTKETAEKTTEADAPKKTEYNKDGYFIQDLMDKIIYISHDTLEYQVYTKDKLTVDDLEENYRNTLILGNDKKQIHESQLEELSIKTFGKNFFTNHPKRIGVHCASYVSNDESGWYRREEGECGGIPPYRYTKITKVESDDKHIYVYQKAGFYGDKGIYKNVSSKNGDYGYETTELIKEVEFPNTVEMSEILDQLNEYKFTFTYDETNNIYYFESVEKQ